jgi:hypothetical protein
MNSICSGDQRRQVERLEYVMGVLRQKGLLSQVDPALLSRVQQVIGEPKEVITASIE